VKVNRFRQILAQEGIPVGHMLVEFDTRNIGRMLEAARVDFVLIDMEHGSYSAHTMADMVASIRATSVTPFVRIPEIQYHFIARALDAGALGIMAPHVDTADDARALVAASKYPPLGKRGLAFGGANSDFVRPELREYLSHSNDNITVICLIESDEALKNLEEIAATSGVDVLWLGYADLTLSLGIPGQYRHHRFLEALTQVASAARRHGLGAGIQPGNLDQAQEWMQAGYNVISYGCDFQVYINAMTVASAAIRNLRREWRSSSRVC
jgi:2-keto-3-deoxy-L-rhamnonate aldolase RhmA